MTRHQPIEVRQRIVTTGIDLFRRKGFIASSVDDICSQAKITKGAFFHHFKSKESLAEECLMHWDGYLANAEANADFQKISDPLKKLAACMDFYIGLFQTPGVLKSCLVGTTVQEVSETHPKLREAANHCFIRAESRLRALLDEVCKARRVKRNTLPMAQLWISTIQGSILLSKASGDDAVISQNLSLVKQYILSQFPKRSSR